MNTVASNNSTDHSVAQPAAAEWLRNYVWLVKRELWEHRRFFISPLVVSAIVVVAVLFGISQMDNAGMTVDGTGIHFKGGGINANINDPESIDGNVNAVRGIHMAAFAGFAVPFFIVCFFVTLHYSLDALYADRRDRSILFWKSLPVSDLETVLSKLFVAVVAAPLVTLVIALATQVVVYVLLTIGLAAHGLDFSKLWAGVPFFEGLLLLVYLVVAIGLWYLPIWSWCLLASSWAQRAVFLWASVPIAAVWFLEYQTLGTNHTGEFLRSRIAGMAELVVAVPRELVEAVQSNGSNTLHITDVITPGVFLSSPQLWIGIAMSAAFVAATVWVRRFRETS